MSLSSDSVSRRGILAGGIGGAGLLTLAACGSSGGGAPPATNPAGGNPPAGSGAGPASGSSGPAAGTKLAALASITVGEAKATTLDGQPIVVARPTATTAACFSAICTHQGCTVVPAGKQLQCPCHGSIYNAVTGAVISGPAPRALNQIRVSVEHGEVVTDG